MSLRIYKQKRDFKRTEEPEGRGRNGKEPAARRFVIQKHDASRLHYDFRLELGGTLKSWAVPKGVPFKKGEKRLAMHVEDHPLEYADFEGIIPKGQYGGGTVMVWDHGTFEPLSEHPQKDLEAGKLHFALHGEKLNGEWTLVRIQHGEKDEWLLIKSGEDMRAVSKRRDDESVLTHRTMARIASDRSAEWSSKSGRVQNLEFVPPMKATLVSSPPASGDWQYELKFDGYRCIATKSGSEVELLSSNAKNFTKKFAEIADAISALKVGNTILDGEIVALDDEGRSSFQLLQGLELGNARPPLAFYVFDLLHCDGADLRELPLTERRRHLEKLLKKAEEPLRFSAEIRGNPVDLLEAVRQRGLEGIIGKEGASRYEAGRRSKAWIKLKCVAEQEVVIGGYTPPEGTRKHFGALLVGVYKGGTLHFAGKVGTGFDAARLKMLHQRMKALAQRECPFANLPEKQQGRWAQNITPREMKSCHWVTPEMVCQVRYGEWTRDGKLRHPVFLGLREDKAAREVTREVAK